MKRVGVIYSVSETFKPFITPSALDLSMILLQASATNKKMKGDSGHPCLKPLVGLKKLDDAPLIMIAKEVDCKHPIIHSTTSNATPIFISKSLTKVHTTLSYAFDKSSFKAKALFSFFLDAMDCFLGYGHIIVNLLVV